MLEDFKERALMQQKMRLEDQIVRYAPDISLEWRHLESFQYLIMENKVTTNTTRLRRINTFKSLVFGGNTNGIIGYGKGTADNGDDALKRAVIDLKSNLVSINLDLINTFPRPIKAKFERYKITLHPRSEFNSWGSFLVSHMIQLAGVHHCNFRVENKQINHYSLVYCLMKLLTQNLTPRQLCEEYGLKLYDTAWLRYHERDDATEIIS